MHCWNETKDCEDMLFEDDLKVLSMFEIYNEDHKGQKLKMDLINQMIASNTSK